ncbi:MAG: NAD(P)-dependent alcohol dehydrogenase [Thaumarchaeota archaeon]|nr:NAD(P)-dependent alcohol dehydrogenase [Nitrososphaerota archaeon]
MKAAVYHGYGTPDVVKLEEIEKPTPEDNQVLIRVHAAAVNPLDWHYVRGTPYLIRLQAGLRRPKEPRIGVDYAGVVEAVGKSVTQFKAEDEVFGGRTGAFAEYVVAREDRALALKPSNATFEQAAAIPVAGITALQGLRDKGKIQAGQKVLVNGAGGGVGSFAVQIAKTFGANVTGACSTGNVELVRSIGADRVIDYTQEDFTKGEQHYDLIFDNVSNHSLGECRRVLMPKGICIVNGGGGPESKWIGPLAGPVKAAVLSPFVSQKFVNFLAKLSKEDLNVLRDLVEAGKMTPVIGNRYSLSEVPEAIRQMEGGHVRGKLVITVEHDGNS